MDDETRRELDAIKGQISNLAAETMALQVIFVQLCNRIAALSPELARAVFGSFDEAADLAESLSIARGKAAGHLPRTLQLIEALRAAVVGEDKPKDAV